MNNKSVTIILTVVITLLIVAVGFFGYNFFKDDKKDDDDGKLNIKSGIKTAINIPEKDNSEDEAFKNEAIDIIKNSPVDAEHADITLEAFYSRAFTEINWSASIEEPNRIVYVKGNYKDGENIVPVVIEYTMGTDGAFSIRAISVNSQSLNYNEQNDFITKLIKEFIDVDKEETKKKEKKQETKKSNSKFYIGDDGCYHCSKCDKIPSKEEYNSGMCNICDGNDDPMAATNGKHQEAVAPYGYCTVCEGSISEYFYNRYGYDGFCSDECYNFYHNSTDNVDEHGINHNICEGCGNEIGLNGGNHYCHDCILDRGYQDY